MKVELSQKEAKNFILLTIAGEEGEENNTVVKVKFFKIDDSRTRVKFVRKFGDIQQWYATLNQMKEIQFEGTLLQSVQPDLVE